MGLGGRGCERKATSKLMGYRCNDVVSEDGTHRTVRAGHLVLHKLPTYFARRYGSGTALGPAPLAELLKLTLEERALVLLGENISVILFMSRARGHGLPPFGTRCLSTYKSGNSVGASAEPLETI